MCNTEKESTVLPMFGNIIMSRLKHVRAKMVLVKKNVHAACCMSCAFLALRWPIPPFSVRNFRRARHCAPQVSMKLRCCANTACERTSYAFGT